MHHFQFKNDELHCENVPVRRIVEETGTPVYIYSRATLDRHFKAFQEPFSRIDHLICYSMKACSNAAVLKIFANLGGGADIVSGGELYRALKAGVPAERIVYSGVGKRAEEIDAALSANIFMFNVESEEELGLIRERAEKAGVKARIAIRVNPDVDPRTHPYISTGLKKNKFGIDVEGSLKLYLAAREIECLDPIGVDCHIGSQLTELAPFLDATDKISELIGRLRGEGVNIRVLDIGGGLGIPYDQEEPPPPSDYGDALVERIKDMRVKLVLEPGRVLVGNAGILVCAALFRKHTSEKEFVIVDAAMNDLIRPSLYKAHHGIERVDVSGPPRERITADIVGPICETGDFIAQGREMDEVKAGDLLAVMSAGAYGFSMSSNYNSRPRAAEVLVDGDRFSVIRKRESYEDLVRHENIPSYLLT